MTNFLSLKKSNCRNCYKCIRNCPVKSIRFSGGQANIIGDECILCGRCFVVCPQNAKEIVSSLEVVKVMIQEGKPVYASIAPSFIANYNGAGIESMREALMKLGFAGVEETAIGATMIKREYERMLEDGGRDVIITSCCHTVNLLIQKHFPAALPFLANVQSPMQAHCADLKKRHPGCKTVFIGPCLSKKDEAERYEGIVDASLTFEELSQWLKDEHMTIRYEADKEVNSRTRIFPTAGGVLASMDWQDKGYTCISIDGIENCMNALKDIESGALHRCFIEMNACPGGCIGGPVMEKYHNSPVQDYARVCSYAGKKDFDVPSVEAKDLEKVFAPIPTGARKPSESEILDILRQMGKTTKEHELNCGSCGYNTCREKAVAVFQGKADVSMCLPFLMSRAESFSDTIINNTQNAIIVLNENCEVQQINNAALRLMNIRFASDVLGDQVVRILDPADFLYVRSTGRGVYNKRVYLAEYRRYVEETIVYDREYRILICFMRDITDEEDQRTRKETISRQTIETTDKIVEKQMRIVQEIASLLGETAAETKIALTRLKESIGNE